MSASAHQLIDEDGHLCNGDSNLWPKKRKKKKEIPTIKKKKKKKIKETTNHSMFYIA